MNRLLLVLSLLLASICASPASAQQQNEYETWIGGFFQGPIAGDVLFTGDVHYRAFDSFEPHWILVRPGISYRFTDTILGTIGYAYTPTWPTPGADVVHEHRIWQQFQLELKLGASDTKLVLRTRLEERLRSTGDDVGARLRQMARVAMPIDAEARFLFVVWDEVFFGLNDTDWGQHGGLDQNRFFVGPGFVVVPGTLRVEPGYMNQFIRGFGGPDRINHVFMINAFVTWSGDPPPPPPTLDPLTDQ